MILFVVKCANVLGRSDRFISAMTLAVHLLRGFCYFRHFAVPTFVICTTFDSKLALAWNSWVGYSSEL